MHFKTLVFGNWRQFRHVNLQFHPGLTILTGANGAGKTTILNLLSSHFGWNEALVSTPEKSSGRDGKFYSSGTWTDSWLEGFLAGFDAEPTPIPPPPPPNLNQPLEEIGRISYSNNVSSLLMVPKAVAPTFNVSITSQQQVSGLHIPSHRPLYSYQKVDKIPAAPKRRASLFSEYVKLVRQRRGTSSAITKHPNHFIKETLIALATFGYGNQAVDADLESLETFEAFQEILRKVLPPSLGFSRIIIRLPEVVFVTRSGDISLDAVSGGIASLIDIAWQIFTYDPKTNPFAVTIDEPENHLHPELQRSVLANLVESFPNVQFICASHNPFIVTSVPDSNVYVLRYGEDRRVYSELLEQVDRAGTSNETLRDVLGLDSSSPLWVEQKLRQVQAEMAARPLDERTLEILRETLTGAGLEKYVPMVLADLAKRRLV